MANAPHTDTFSSLFEEFAASYLPTAKAAQKIALHQVSVAQGRANYRAISSAASHGHDVTDEILRKLLPHANTAYNRDRDVWIHVAPAVTKDAERLILGAGRVRPENLPQAAAAILRFVRRANLHPDQLAKACAEFASLSFIKGIQSGMLSPILNALRPERFPLVNNAVRAAIAALAGTAVSTRIADYPKASGIIDDFLKTRRDEMLRLAGRADLHPTFLLNLFAHWLAAERKLAPRGKPQSGVRYWKISPGEKDSQWEACRANGYISMGGEELGDLSAMSRERFRAARDRLIAENPSWSRAKLNQLWRFAHIAPGDRVIVSDGRREILGIGTVTGAYRFVPGERFGHRLAVDWHDTEPRRVRRNGWRRALLELDGREYEEIARSEPANGHAAEPASEPEEMVSEPKQRYRSQPEPEPIPQVQPEYSLEQCSVESGFDIESLAGFTRAIERKGQAIIFGPPGTGKTYIAVRLARHLVGGGDGFVDTVQFHPAYAYEDFVEGIRPQPGAGGALEYPMVPGRFLEFCDRAVTRTGRCVMVIDEINRANLARVFGELMYLLEYRDEEIPLAGGRRFRIPANVRIIGTMNTADRSIALVDHALRRRFAFLELRPDFALLARYHAEHNPGFDAAALVAVLRDLNLAIGDRHYEVGISFFLRPRIKEQIEEIWRTEIEPYIAEYFFDQPSKAEAFGWDAIGGKIAGR